MVAWNRHTGKVAAVITAIVAATVWAGPPVANDKEIARLAKDKAKMADAQGKFATNCAACHGQQGQGLIGPNLTDKFWIKGASPTDIAKSIEVGNPAKGMPPMVQILGADGVKQLAAYVLTLKDKNLPGKGPEGTAAK